MGDLLDRDRRHDDPPRAGPARADQHRQHRAGRALRARRADPGLDQRARTAPHTLRARPAVAAGRRRLRLPPDRHARAGPGSDGGHVQVQPRLHRGVRRPAARRRHHLRLPERRAPPRTSLMAAVLAEGHHGIDNAAREPEITDLCEFLIAMGAEHRRASAPRPSSSRASSPGSLRPVRHHTVPDRIQAATYVAAVAVAGRRADAATAPAPSTWRCSSNASPTWASTSRAARWQLRVRPPRTAALDRRGDPAVSRASPPTTSR